MFAGFAFVVFGVNNGTKVQLGIFGTRAKADAAIAKYVLADADDGMGDTRADYTVWKTTNDFLA